MAKHHLTRRRLLELTSVSVTGLAAFRIARQGIEMSQRLGRHRWVIERTLVRLSRYRR